MKNKWKMIATRAGVVASLVGWPFAGAMAAGFDRGNTAMPVNQFQTKHDERLVHHVRKSINAEKSLSTKAKNVKIVSVNGKLILRGPVQTAAERDLIERKACDIAGLENVDDQLEVVAK